MDIVRKHHLIALLLGAAAPVFLPQWPSLLWLGLVFLICAAGLIPRWSRELSLLILLALIGLVINLYQLHTRITDQLPLSWQGETLHLSVHIDGMPNKTDEMLRFVGTVREVHGGAPKSDYRLQGKKLRLSWYLRYNKQRTRLLDKQIRKMAPGQTWQLAVRLRRPRGLHNPKGFDYHAWLLAQGIHATGYVRKWKGNQLQQDPQDKAFPMPSFESLRHTLATDLFAPLTTLKHAPLLKALLIGDKNDINSEQWQVLNNSGTVHLMAISGLHIGLVAFLTFTLAQFTVRAAAVCGYRRGLFWVPPLLSTLTASFYAGLAGFSLPTQRALVLVLTINLALLLKRKTSPMHALIIAALLAVFIDPFALKQAGFCLSFGAVFLLLFSFYGRLDQARGTYHFFLSQSVIFIGLLIPLALLSLPISITAPFANAIAIPLVSIALVPLVLMAAVICLFSIKGAQLILQLCDGLFSFLWRFLEFCAHVSEPIWFTLPPFFALISIAALLLFLLPSALYFRAFGALILSMILLASWFNRNTPDGTELKLTFLDVGQGLAVVIQAGEEVWVYDTGAKMSDRFDIGRHVILPFLRSHNRHKIDGLIVSHADNDHRGGLESILATMLVKKLKLSQFNLPVYDQAKEKIENTVACKAGQSWLINKVQFEILWPPENQNNLGSNNNHSCVLLITYNNYRILLPGDIETSVEKTLSSHTALKHGVDLILAPHHGSKTSSSALFLKKIEPEQVIFSAGFKNRYGHPHPSIVKRYNNMGTKINSTANHGAITYLWTDDATEPNIQHERKINPRLWFDK